MQDIFNQRHPINAQNVLTVVDQYIELAGELTKSSAILRSAYRAAAARLAHQSDSVVSPPYAITRMQQVLTQLDYLSEACNHFAIDLLCGTDYPWSEAPPLFAAIPDFKYTEELANTLVTQIQHLSAVLATAETWFKSPIILAWTAADLLQAASTFLNLIPSDKQTQLPFISRRDFNEM